MTSTGGELLSREVSILVVQNKPRSELGGSSSVLTVSSSTSKCKAELFVAEVYHEFVFCETNQKY